MKSYKSPTQTEKNIAWFLPRPHRSHYKGAMPLHCEKWLLMLADEILGYKGNPNVMPDENRLLNLFCGMNEYGLRVDIKADVKPDRISDAHIVSQCFPHETKFEIILADPPYSDKECKDLYDINIPLKYKVWTAECDKLLKPSGLLIVYHKYVMPNPDPNKYEVVKRVFIGNRTYHLPRVAIYFRKKIKKS